MGVKPDSLAKMKVVLSTLFLFVASTTASSLLNSQWTKFKADFEKVYSTPAEEALRKATFAQNLAKVEEHNKKGLSWTEGINHFSDLTKEEFVNLYASGRTRTAGPRAAVDYQRQKKQNKMSDLPAEVDWRTEGVVTQVRNQGQCGSCWAFAAASVMASYAAINDRSHELLEISPQHIVSCTPNPLKCGGTGGCMGSIPQLGYTYIQLFGHVTEDDYPYTSGTTTDTGDCMYDFMNTAP